MTEKENITIESGSGLDGKVLCPGGGIGRRAGLKIQCPQQTCGFDSRPGYKLKIKELDII